MSSNIISPSPGSQLNSSLTTKVQREQCGEIGVSDIAGIELEHSIGFLAKTKGALALHPSSNAYISVSGSSLLVNDLSDTHNQVFLRGHSDNISCLCVSNSGRLVASGQQGMNSDVIVWDYENKDIKYRLEEHQYGIEALCFSDDERFLATAGGINDAKIIIWDMMTGFIVCLAAAAPNLIGCIAWGGRVKDIKRRKTTQYHIATTGQRESKIHLWTLTPATGELVFEQLITGSHKRVYTDVVFSDDTEFLLAGSTSGDISVFLVRNRGLSVRLQVCGGGVCSLVSASEGSFIVGGGDGTLTHFCRESAKSYVNTSQTQLNGSIKSLSKNSNHGDLIAGTTNGEVYRVSTGTMESVLLSQNHSSAVVGIAFPDGVSERFATCSSDGTVKMWDVSDYSLLCNGVAIPHLPTCICVSEECIITGWNDGIIRSFDAMSGERLWDIDNAHTGSATALALSANEKFIVSGGDDGGVRVWEVRSKDLISHLKEHTNHISGVKIYADNRHALTCSRDRSILSWDLEAEARVTGHRQNMGGINDIALTMDHSLVLSVGQERRITFWDLRISRAVKYVELGSEALCVDTSNDGKMFVAAGENSEVKFYDSRNSKLIANGIGHSASINAVSFSPDNKQLTSVGDDSNVLIWNVYSD